MRALGIPSRLVSGGWSYGINQFHVWSEILIPNYGWIPVDVSVADVFVYDEGEELNALGRKSLHVFPPIKDPLYFFGNIDPFRYVSSIGSDIEIFPKLDWDFTQYNASTLYHQGKAGIMQIGVFYLPMLDKVEMSFK